MPKAKSEPAPRKMTVGEGIAEAVDLMIRAKISSDAGKPDSAIDYDGAKKQLARAVDSRKTQNSVDSKSAKDNRVPQPWNPEAWEAFCNTCQEFHGVEVVSAVHQEEGQEYLVYTCLVCHEILLTIQRAF